MNLSQNFTLAELTHSQMAKDCNIDNTPDELAVQNLQLLCKHILQPIRDHYAKPVKVNSGYRSTEVNSLVRGSSVSDHVFGCAADIEVNGITNVDLASWIKDNLQFSQCILEFYTPGQPSSGWVHVSYKPQNLKCQTLTASKTDGKTHYQTGIIA